MTFSLSCCADHRCGLWFEPESATLLKLSIQHVRIGYWIFPELLNWRLVSAFFTWALYSDKEPHLQQMHWRNGFYLCMKGLLSGFPIKRSCLGSANTSELLYWPSFSDLDWSWECYSAETFSLPCLHWFCAFAWSIVLSTVLGSSISMSTLLW